MEDVLLEITIRVPTPVCILSQKFGKFIKVIDIRSHGDKVAHLIEVSSKLVDELNVLAESTGGVLQSIKIEGDRATGWFMSSGCDACRPLAFGEAFLIRGLILPNGIMEFSFIVPRDASYEDILSKLKASNIEYEVIKLTSSRGSRLLTSNQEKVLYIAYRMGLFDHPRKIQIKDLADMLGVSSSSLTESLRRGLKRLLDYYFKSTP
jgi:hypothetical protein